MSKTASTLDLVYSKKLTLLQNPVRFPVLAYIPRVETVMLK
jgi:hypothetical protein